jgi:hypothetical protein
VCQRRRTCKQCISRNKAGYLHNAGDRAVLRDFCHSTVEPTNAAASTQPEGEQLGLSGAASRNDNMLTLRVHNRRLAVIEHNFVCLLVPRCLHQKQQHNTRMASARIEQNKPTHHSESTDTDASDSLWSPCCQWSYHTSPDRTCTPAIHR